MKEKIEYLKWMLENLPQESEISLNDGKRDRWIGFIQGVLWCLNINNIDELRNETRSGNAVNHIKHTLDTFKINDEYNNLSELVADLRNKFGSIVSYFSLLECLEKHDDLIMKEKLNKLLEENKITSILLMKEIKKLLDQFENFDL
jgi:hypothetical protein